MPDWVQDEDKWSKAKKIASDEGHKDEYDYITGIYKKMGGKIKSSKERLNKLYESFKEAKDWMVKCLDCGARFNQRGNVDRNRNKNYCPQCKQTKQDSDIKYEVLKK